MLKVDLVKPCGTWEKKPLFFFIFLRLCCYSSPFQTKMHAFIQFFWPGLYWKSSDEFCLIEQARGPLNLLIKKKRMKKEKPIEIPMLLVSSRYASVILLIN